MELWTLEYKFCSEFQASRNYPGRTVHGWMPSNRGNLTLEKHIEYIADHMITEPHYYTNGRTWVWRLRNLQTDETIPVEILAP